MSSALESDNKLQFYPTDVIETYRILGVLSKPRRIWEKSQEFRDIYGSSKCKQLYEKYKKDLDTYIFEDLLKNNRLDLINEYFELNLGYSDKSNLVVADLFAGEGKWLKLFKNISNCNYLIGNELEINRYNSMIEDNLIDYHYNLSFEELQLPRKIINLMLFNPPYGSSNGEANVRRYLKMILERDLMVKNGVMVLVIKKRDALTCSDLITKYFAPNILCYKTNDDEFNKWSQLIIYAKLRDTPLNLNDVNDLAKYHQDKESLELTFNQDIEFDICFYKALNYQWKEYDIKKAFDNFKYIVSDKKFISNSKDKAWKWLFKDTEIKDLGEEIITVPKNLKSGELANIIASGKINGELSLENGVAKHIAVGGVKTITSENNITVEDKKTGQQVNKLETTIKSVPYLNLLINNNGKMEIKELKENAEREES